MGHRHGCLLETRPKQESLICKTVALTCTFVRYDADQNKDKKSFQGNGVLICSIDNMPTQLPREATDYFGDLLLPYVQDILKSDAKKPFLENKVRNRWNRR